MKKMTLILSVMLLACSTSFAQLKGFAIGVKGGVNFTQVKTDAGTLQSSIKESLDTKTGYVGGVWGRFGKGVFVQPEILVASKGGKIQIGSATPLDFKYTNLEVPLLVGTKIAKVIRINAGPVATLKIAEDQKLKDALKAYSSTAIDQTFKGASFGYQAGIGIDFMGISVDLRREGSLSEISQLKLQNNAQFNQKAQGWVLTAAIKLI